jgi:AsmA protein
VVIDGPWAQPRIYPDVAGILDNPDAAYAKLKDMGKGLFGSGSELGGNSDSGSGNSGLSDQLRSRLGETLGNLLQQGLSQSRKPNRGTPDSSPAAPAQNDPPAQQQDSQPLNDVMKQLFGR